MTQNIKFNQSQLRAIAHGEGPALVLAGPGSGKTAVITERIHHLIYNLKVPPEKILVLTYTRKAAAEMKERFAVRMKNKMSFFNKERSLEKYSDQVSNNRVVFGTFHSIFWHILLEETSLDQKAILTEEEQKRIIKICYQKLLERRSDGYEKNKYDKPVTQKNSESSEIQYQNLNDDELEMYISTLSRISAGMSAGVSAGSFIKNLMKCLSEKSVKTGFASEEMELYRLYNSEKRSLRKVDYDDMAKGCIMLFNSHPEILEKWQSRFDYILLDEFQDINETQYRIMAMLGKNGNVFAVGDDDQSIYSFRGSSPEFMFRFLKDHPKTRKYVLNVNYRSTPEIVRFSQKLIINNRKRMEKNIVAGNRMNGNLELRKYPGKYQERMGILDKMKQLNGQGVPWSEMAVLTRKNYDLTEYERLLSTEGIDGVVLTTFHGSKGLEFTAVFLPLLIEGIVPAPESLKNGDPEEERRMFYVAMTRAKKYLFLSMPEMTSGKYRNMSVYVRELVGSLVKVNSTL